jgi:hypothetical protein
MTTLAPDAVAGETSRWLSGLSRSHSVRNLSGPAADVSIVIIAVAGAWLLWSQYSYLSGLSWWYANTQTIHARTAGVRPDYTVSSLPWRAAHPRMFDIRPDGMSIVTNEEPFTYEAFATIETGGARAVDVVFAADVEAGGVTIGLLQGGRWVATSSTRNGGRFEGVNSAQLSRRGSLTVVIANNNPAGQSRFSIRMLRLFLRK